MAMDLATFGRFSKTFQAGEMIFSEFEPGDTFYLIQAGRVELVKIMGDIQKTLDILQPSEMFVEMALLENSPRSASAIALDTVKALEFNRQNFEVLMLGNPQIALKLLKMFTKRIYDSKRRYMILTLSDNTARVADCFLMLDETTPGLDRSGDQREFNTTVDDVAHWVGMSVAQVRDIISHFVAQRRIDLFQDRIVVRNINDLARLVASRRKKT